MFERWRSNGAWPLGCAVGADAVRVVQLRGEGEGLGICARDAPIEAQAAARDGGPNAAAGALRQVLKDSQFVGREAVICLPLDRIRYRHLRLAPMPDAELPTAVRWRAAREFDQQVDQLIADYLDVGQVLESGRTRREVIAVAAPREDVEAYVQTAHSAGLELLAIDAEAAAVARCLAAPDLERSDTPARFVIDLGVEDSALMVVHNALPRFIRAIGAGRRGIIAEAAETVGGGPDQHAALARMLQASHENASSGEANAGATEADATAQRRMQDALDAACARVADELAHAVTLCAHYLNQARLNDFQPRVGCIVGAGRQERVLIDALNRACKIEFEPLSDAVAPRVRTLLQHLPAETAPDDWILPIGLALYGQEHVLEEVAA